MRSRELEPNELQWHTRENNVTVQFCSALQNWPLSLYQVLYQLVELLDPIEVFNFTTGLWYFLRAPHKVLIQNEHTLPINDYIIMRYWPSVRSRLLGIMSFFLRFLCAFPVMHHRCQSEKGLPKTHLKVKYGNALYKFLALIWKCFRSAKLDQYAKT